MNTEMITADFFSDSQSVLLHGDCIEKLKVIPAQSVNLLLTDPPYNLGLFMKGRGTNMGKLRENHFAVSGWDQLGTEGTGIYTLAS